MRLPLPWSVLLRCWGGSNFLFDGADRLGFFSVGVLTALDNLVGTPKK